MIIWFTRRFVDRNTSHGSYRMELNVSRLELWSRSKAVVFTKTVWEYSAKNRKGSVGTSTCSTCSTTDRKRMKLAADWSAAMALVRSAKGVLPAVVLAPTAPPTVTPSASSPAAPKLHMPQQPPLRPSCCCSYSSRCSFCQAFDSTRGRMPFR